MNATVGWGRYVVNDVVDDPRTAEHALVVGDLALRFYAAAPIVTSDGHALGTVNVLDRRLHRDVSVTQTDLLADLATTVAQSVEIRLSALAILRAETAKWADQTERRNSVDRSREPTSQSAHAAHSRERPQWCELGEVGDCREPAEMKVADSWGDSAWGAGGTLRTR
jgi:hypothetical protein